MTTGLYGKMPSTGDFISWNLPRIFIDRWDRWMSMELRDRPDTGELDPRIWRFAIGTGIFGDAPCAGGWRMSEDRVGRRYPLAIVRLGQPPAADDAWFDEVAKLLTGCVEEFWSHPELQERVADLPAPDSFDPRDRIAFWTDGREGSELVFGDIYDLADNGLFTMRQAPAPTEA